MSLEQFLGVPNGTQEPNPTEDVGGDGDGQFFERVNAQTKEVLNKEHKNEKLLRPEQKKIQKESKSFNNEIITIAQMQVSNCRCVFSSDCC